MIPTLAAIAVGALFAIAVIAVLVFRPDLAPGPRAWIGKQSSPKPGLVQDAGELREREQ